MLSYLSLLLLVPSPFFALIPVAPPSASSYIACICGLTERKRAGHEIGERVRGKDLARQPVENILISVAILAHSILLNLAKPPNRNGGVPSEDVNEWTASLFSPDSFNRLSVFDRGESPAQPSRCLLLCQVVCCRTHVAHHGVVCAQVISSSLFGAWCVSDALSNAPHLYILDTCYDVGLMLAICM